MNLQEPCLANGYSLGQSITKTQTLDFFIVGFPRSRLAWISNYLTWGNTECHFDGFKHGLGGPIGPDIVEEFAKSDKVVGVADGGAVMFQDRLIARWPNAKWVIIERPYFQVVNSLQRLDVPIDQRLANLHYKIGELKLKTSPLIVPFDTLDCSIEDIARYVNPGWHCPSSRQAMLLDLNVQSKRTKDDLINIPDINPLSEKAEPPVPTKTQEDYFALLQEICGEDKFAYRWLQQAVTCAGVMDHVRDSDPIDFNHFYTTMKALLLEWGINPFFRQYAPQLIPPMGAAISAWQHATGDMKRVKHYDIYSEMPCIVAFILGTQERVDKYSPRLRTLVEQLMFEDNRRDGD